MSGYGVAMRRTEKQMKPEVNTCGDCGGEISDSQILCQSCLWLQLDGKAYDEKTISREEK
jgi:hypothetical protein